MPGPGQFWYAGDVKSPVSIALFFLLSAFFLFALLAALQHSGKALAIAIACLAACVCIVVFLTPVRLPAWWPIKGRVTTTTVVGASGTTALGATTTTLPGPTTTVRSASGTTTTGATQ
jgi:hypothetical protein